MHRSLVIRKQNVSDVQNGYFEIFRIWGKMSEFELNTSTVADDEAFCWFCWFFTTSFSLLFFFLPSSIVVFVSAHRQSRKYVTRGSRGSIYRYFFLRSRYASITVYSISKYIYLLLRQRLSCHCWQRSRIFNIGVIYLTPMTVLTVTPCAMSIGRGKKWAFRVTSMQIRFEWVLGTFHSSYYLYFVEKIKSP